MPARRHGVRSVAEGGTSGAVYSTCGSRCVKRAQVTTLHLPVRSALGYVQTASTSTRRRAGASEVRLCRQSILRLRFGRIADAPVQIGVIAAVTVGWSRNRSSNEKQKYQPCAFRESNPGLVRIATLASTYSTTRPKVLLLIIDITLKVGVYIPWTHVNGTKIASVEKHTEAPVEGRTTLAGCTTDATGWSRSRSSDKKQQKMLVRLPGIEPGSRAICDVGKHVFYH